MGCHFLLQEIFLTQGSNLGLPHCRQTLTLWATREESYLLFYPEKELRKMLLEMLRLSTFHSPSWTPRASAYDSDVQCCLSWEHIYVMGHVQLRVHRWHSGKDSSCNAGDVRDMGLISGSGGYLGEWNGNPLQNSCLENSMDRGSWRAAVHGVPKNHTCLMPEVWEAHKFRLNLTLWKIPCTYFSVYHLATIPPWAGSCEICISDPALLERCSWWQALLR